MSKFLPVPDQPWSLMMPAVKVYVSRYEETSGISYWVTFERGDGKTITPHNFKHWTGKALEYYRTHVEGFKNISEDEALDRALTEADEYSRFFGLGSVTYTKADGTIVKPSMEMGEY